MKSKHGKTRPATKRATAIVIAVIAGTGLTALAALSAIRLSTPSAAEEQAEVVVYKRSGCSCCDKWVTHLRDNGLTVRVNSLMSTRPIQSRLGVPDALRSCHTAEVGDYWVEGHVPADLVRELLDEQPNDVRGLAVPGMPIGSPGMEGPNPVQYSVMRVEQDGEIEVHAERQGAESAP